MVSCDFSFDYGTFTISLKYFISLDLPSTNDAHYCFEPEKVTDYPDFLFLTITNTHANTSLQSSFNNMLKSIANLTISKEKLMCV